MSIIKYIASDIFLLKRDVVSIAISAPFRYKEYPIPKRSGGYRKIAQPSREVKLLQKSCVNWMRDKLPVHESATAYIKGKGIRDNAEAHVNNNYILKMDFSNFFPSIKPKDFKLHFNKYSSNNLSDEEMLLLLRILFWKPKGINELMLSIGAPSSPFISNTIMYDFDVLVRKFADNKNITYTRYADDLTFSAQNIDNLRFMSERINDCLNELVYPKLKLNDKKTTFVTKKYRRTVTGLVLTNDNKISLGRERKRNIRSSIHHYILGGMNKDEINILKGWLAFALDVEPEFFAKMKDKYGKETINKIMNSI